jgi:hypothetical protein|tara:strand:- start:311 stop:583 length:273 start_codon:yes stop_codon:yes gene_type:complete
MWKSLSELPTLTEIFFGKGVDPAKYRGENKTPLSSKGKAKAKTKKKASKPKTGGKSITEVKKTAPKNGMTPDKPRGTRKDYTLNKKLKKK